MMNHKNKCIYFFAIFVTAIAIFNTKILEVQAYTNQYNISMTEAEYNTLLALGFSQDEISYMDLETFNLNKDADATLLAREIKHYEYVSNNYGFGYVTELSEEEFNNRSNDLILDGQQRSNKTVVSTLSQNGTRYRYKVSVMWNIIPNVKKYDIIGIGYQDDVHVYNNIVYFAYHYTTTSSSYTSSQYYNRKITDLGATIVYKLPDSFNGLSTALYYDVEKDAGAGTLTGLTFCGDYAHAISNSVTSTLAAHHSIGYGGIGLFADNITLYDAIPCTYGIINCISW